MIPAIQNGTPTIKRRRRITFSIICMSSRKVRISGAAKLVDARLRPTGDTHDGGLGHVIDIDRLKPGVCADHRQDRGHARHLARIG